MSHQQHRPRDHDDDQQYYSIKRTMEIIFVTRLVLYRVISYRNCYNNVAFCEKLRF